MRPIEKILEDWKKEFGLLGKGKNGPYRYIQFSQKREYLIILVQTLLKEGYVKEDFLNTRIRNLIINACHAPDEALSCSASKIKKSKDITSRDLDYAISEVTPTETVFSTAKLKENAPVVVVPKKTVSAPKLPAYEIDQSKEIKLDTSDMPDVAFAEDLLAELAAIGTIVDRDNE